MSVLKEIKEPLKEHWNNFDRIFRESMKSPIPLLNRVTRYIIKRKGKQMRPMFVLLSADLCGEVNESTYRAASLIELLHTATLVHDDVVDDSNFRRGFFSINALWKNKIAVLVGDFLLSRGLIMAVDHEEFELLKIVSEATRDMSEGELLQIEKARKLDIKEPVYFDIIRKKTAALIAACCASGASSVNASPDNILKMKMFGEKVGIAFQIKDDLFDYESNGMTGKPEGIDIKEKKMTLPLINMLNHLDYLDKRKVIRIVKHHNQNPEKVAEVVALVNRSGGIDYARDKMMAFKREALEMLDDFPEGVSRESLRKLVSFTVERKR